MVFRRKQSPYYYYRFMRNGVPVYINTKQKNKATAEEMEAAHRTRLARGEAGLQTGKAPTLAAFEARFTAALRVKPSTAAFYADVYRMLLTFAPLASCRLDRIDDALIARYVQSCNGLAAATVNRRLATLRRALKLAQEWRVIVRAPNVRLLPGENAREYVLDRETEARYLAACPQPLQDAATLMLDTALRVSEALNLMWADVQLEPAVGKRFGYVQVRDGKSKNARRAVSLTARSVEMLKRRQAEAVNDLVFPGASLERPYRYNSLDVLHARVRTDEDLPAAFVLHSLRHTMLTRLGAAGVDAFTIMKIAGHSSLAVAQRYVHPSSDAMEAAFEKLVSAQLVQSAS